MEALAGKHRGPGLCPLKHRMCIGGVSEGAVAHWPSPQLSYISTILTLGIPEGFQETSVIQSRKVWENPNKTVD